MYRIQIDLNNRGFKRLCLTYIYLKQEANNQRHSFDFKLAMEGTENLFPQFKDAYFNSNKLVKLDNGMQCN